VDVLGWGGKILLNTLGDESVWFLFRGLLTVISPNNFNVNYCLLFVDGEKVKPGPFNTS
jgi:hypothetical protein